jgi:type IV secretion system protein TrbE
MQLDCPSGYFVDDHAVWGDPASGAVLSRFYSIDFPDTSASDDSVLNAFERDLRLMLGCLKTDERLQLQYYTSSEFSGALDRFESETRKSHVPVCNEVRGELVERYRDRMAHETLIQANVRLSLSTRMPKSIRGFDEVFKVLARSFEQREQFFNLLLASYGGSVKGLNNVGHYDELVKFWSPGQARQPRFTDIDWLRSISDLCRFSGLSPRQEPDHGFYLDGYYCGVLVAKTMPRATWAKTMEPFLAMAIPNLRVVVNMEGLPIDAEMRHEEERFSKLASNIDLKSPSLQSEVGLDKHRDRMRLLMSNKVVPFRAQLIVIVCDRTRDGLDGRIEAVRAALGKTGCEPWQPSVPTSTIAFFNCATPGIGPWVKYRDFWHKMDDAVNVVNMWPAGSTPCADLSYADWITDGHLNNLIGGRMFIGAQPVHMLCAATTGSGKSVLLQTLTLQTAHQFKLIVVIDDGLSWLTTCKKLDPTCRPIVVRSNGDQTFNVFDTRRQPLSNQHLASATALVHLLVGQHSDSDKDKLRHAVLAETIVTVYGSAFRKWRKNHPQEYFQLCEDLSVDLDASEIEWQLFARWTPAMFPTLFDLQDELHAQATQKGPHQELCATLASLLRPWLRDGIYGPIVDGASNIDLGSAQMSDNDPLKVIHFELGEMGESEAELKAVVGFLITNEVRNHIQGMPRGLRKLAVIEEMTAFLKVPNGAQIVVDYYQQMRKYSCQVVSVFQQYSTLLEASPKVAKSIVHGASAMLLLRNHNRQDLDTLSGFLPKPIPDVIKDHVTRFPKPAEFTNRDEAYAGFVYVQLGTEDPRYTVGRNYISYEVEQITSSSGDVFEAKKAELKKVIKMENAA